MRNFMSNRKRGLAAAFFMLIFLNVAVGSLYPQNARQHIRAGNRDYRAGKFGDSELEYRRAAEVERSTPDAWFNLGNSIYRQERFDDAAESFRKNASLNDDAVRKANSYYNLGNSLLSAQKVEESIDAYKNSLKLNPDNLEAKFNLAYAQDLLRQQQEQEQDQQQSGDENQDDSNEDQNQNKDKDQEQEQPPGDNEKEQGRNEKDNPQRESDNQPVISEEDARRLLEALAENEKELQEKVKKDKAAAAMIRTLKNW